MRLESSAVKDKSASGGPSRKREPAIDVYLARLSPPTRSVLQRLRKMIQAISPGVEECISYGLPAFRLRGKVIAGFSATAQGCSYYPFSGRTLEALARDIAGHSHTKSALHFTPDRPLSVSLVRKLIKARVAEGTERRTRLP